jgi:hypothetical protein
MNAYVKKLNAAVAVEQAKRAEGERVAIQAVRERLTPPDEWLSRLLATTSDGFHRKPDPTQFEGFADKYWKFASVLRFPPNDVGVPEEQPLHPSYNLFDEWGYTHRSRQPQSGSGGNISHDQRAAETRCSRLSKKRSSGSRP